MMEIRKEKKPFPCVICKKSFIDLHVDTFLITNAKYPYRVDVCHQCCHKHYHHKRRHLTSEDLEDYL